MLHWTDDRFYSVKISSGSKRLKKKIIYKLVLYLLEYKTWRNTIECYTANWLWQNGCWLIMTICLFMIWLIFNVGINTVIKHLNHPMLAHITLFTWHVGKQDQTVGRLLIGCCLEVMWQKQGLLTLWWMLCSMLLQCDTGMSDFVVSTHVNGCHNCFVYVPWLSFNLKTSKQYNSQ